MTTTTLETARLMKEAGFSQQTDFVWRKYNSWIVELRSEDYTVDGWSPKEIDELSAHSTDELLAILPYRIKMKEYNWYAPLRIEKCDNFYTVGYIGDGFGWPLFKNEILAESLAEMAIYLRKEGLI